MNENANLTGRVIALDCHPDSFTAALLRGPTPAAAVVEKTFNKVPLGQLTDWAKKHTEPGDQFVLEASGNSFQIVRRLATVERQALVLESCQMGKLKEAHANNDKISAVRIGKAYLAGTAKIVWVPDAKTQERRDWFHAHRKAVKRTTQTRNRLLSYLSDNGVRLAKGTPLTQSAATEAHLRKLRDWSSRQWQVIAGLLLELRHADEQRAHWRSLIAQEVLGDPQLLSLVRLCGIREMVAFALGAVIGDINRFAEPRKLTVAIWYLLMGRWTKLEEVDDRLALKVGKILASVGTKGLKELGKTRKTFRAEIYQTLKTGRDYVLEPAKKFSPKPAT